MECPRHSGVRRRRRDVGDGRHVSWGTPGAVLLSFVDKLFPDMFSDL